MRCVEFSQTASERMFWSKRSISKSLTAYAILKLISEKKIKLYKSANDYLTSWKIPKNNFNRNNPVKIIDLLDMTSGMTVSGFPGYKKGEKLPTNIQLLNGNNPSNTPDVKLFYTPGSKYFYSGGAFQVLQQIILDVTHQKFNDFMNKDVLNKLGMNESSFQYPLENKYLLSRAVIAYTGRNDKKVLGGWRNYASFGAAGMWSTPTDIANFAINVSLSLKGKSNAYLPEDITQEMLTRQKNTDFGLGVVVAGKGKSLYFWKAGHNYGYHSLVIMFPNIGKGLVIMTNSETGNIIIDYLVAYIAHQYKWPYYFPFFDELVEVPDFEN